MLNKNKPSKITNIHQSMEVLCAETERLVEDHKNGKKINYHVEATISRRFDTITRKAALMLRERKETGRKEVPEFFKNG
jgi:hypothetical protein